MGTSPWRPPFFGKSISTLQYIASAPDVIAKAYLKVYHTFTIEIANADD